MASNYERDKESIMKYQKENTVYVKVAMNREEKANWQAVADASGMPLGTLLRQLMNNYMENKKSVG